MLKKGFTLQEMLISLLIIGVVAAIAVPGITTLMPDQTKAKYLKAYNTLSTLTSEILNDPLLYWTAYGVDGNPQCTGMQCMQPPQNYTPCSRNWQCAGLSKFPAILATKLNVLTRNQNNNAVLILTTDGVRWEFQSRNTPPQGLITTQLILSTDSSAANQCFYSNGCRKPTMFRFIINNDGSINAEDALGRAYLENPTKLNDIQKDFARAAELFGN